MNKYFFKVTMTYTSKNRAHKTMCNYATMHDNTLLSSDENKAKFINDFREKLAQVNRMNPRCNDLAFSGYYSYEGTVNESLGISGNYSCVIYKVKHEILFRAYLFWFIQ